MGGRNVPAIPGLPRLLEAVVSPVTMAPSDAAPVLDADPMPAVCDAHEVTNSGRHSRTMASNCCP